MATAAAGSGATGEGRRRPNGQQAGGHHAQHDRLRRGRRAANPRRAITVTLKAVNHRFLDVQLRLSDELRASEAALRELLARELVRGRVEVRVEVRAAAASAAARWPSIWTWCGRCTRRCASCVDGGVLTGGLTAGDLLRMPRGPAGGELAAEGWDELDEELLLERRGGGRGAAHRRPGGGGRRPGGGARRSGWRRWPRPSRSSTRCAARRSAEMRRGLRRRIAELLAGQPLDESRVAQEVALLVDRGDVSEEIDRLRSHLEHFRAVAGESAASRQAVRFPHPGDLPRAQHPGGQVPQRRDDPRGARRQGPVRAAARAGPERGIASPGPWLVVVIASGDSF